MGWVLAGSHVGAEGPHVVSTAQQLLYRILGANGRGDDALPVAGQRVCLAFLQCGHGSTSKRADNLCGEDVLARLWEVRGVEVVQSWPSIKKLPRPMPAVVSLRLSGRYGRFLNSNTSILIGVKGH